MTRIQELKAHAYDCLVNIELFKKEIEAINKLIAELQNEEYMKADSEKKVADEQTPFEPINEKEAETKEEGL